MEIGICGRYIYCDSCLCTIKHGLRIKHAAELRSGASRLFEFPFDDGLFVCEIYSTRYKRYNVASRRN